MRVLKLYNVRRVRGGEDVMVDSITRLLRQHGDDVHLWTRENSEFENSLLGKIGVFFSGIYSPSAARAMTRMIEQVQPDIIHAHNLYPLFTPSVLAAARRGKVPVVYHCHSYLLTCPITFHFRDERICELCLPDQHYWCVVKNCRTNILESLGYALRIMIARKYRLFEDNVTIFITLSQFIKNQLIKGGFPESRIRVLPNIVSVPESACNPESGEYVAYSGRISVEKGVGTLLEAAARLPEIPFRICGEGALKDRMAGEAPKNVKFVGWLDRPQLYEFYRKARLAVVPSVWFEPFGLVAAEAMSHGLPVIASRTGGLEEVITPGETGLFVDPGNSGDLEAKIKSLWENPELCRRMGLAARERVMQEYCPEVYYDRLNAIYHKAMELNSRMA